MGVLGDGRNEAWLYMKGGQVPIAPIEGPSSIEWNRVLNDVSDAAIDIPTGQHGECCSVYGKIGTWGHEVVIFRDDQRVWEGPLTNIKWRRGGVSLIAQDQLGRSKKTAVDQSIVHPEPGFFAVDEFWDDVGRTFAAQDPNVLAHRLRLGVSTGPKVTRDVKVYGGYYYDQLLELVKGGAMFTVVGRRILMWPSTTTIGITATLLPASHMSGEVEIEEDGMELSAGAIASNDEGLYGVGAGSAVDAFYGLVETLIASSETGVTSLAATAGDWRKGHYPAPLRVNLPADSVLSCEAPFGMEELIPGTLVPVKIEEGICKSVLSTHQLTSVKVTQDASGEKVSVTLDSASGQVLP